MVVEYLDGSASHLWSMLGVFHTTQQQPGLSAGLLAGTGCRHPGPMGSTCPSSGILTDEVDRRKLASAPATTPTLREIYQMAR